MTWIRGPLWDGFWLLSGLPIGLGLVIVAIVFVPGQYMPALIAAIMLLESAHVASPIMLAWSKPELRAIVRREWREYVVLPVALIAGVLLAPATWVAGFYFAWNIYHFGMQNFGLASLYVRGGDREMRGVICLLLTAFGMGIVPLLWQDQKVTMFCTGIFSFNHWLADIGLSSRVVRWHWGFIALVLLVGFVWLILRQGPLSGRAVPQIMVIRYGIGMIHIIYSARIWRLSNPEIRAAIALR
jgi:hypothetical protein